MPEIDEALRCADEFRDCDTCSRRTKHRVVNYKNKDEISCTECRTAQTIWYEGQTPTRQQTRVKKKPIPPEKKLGRPLKNKENG